MFFDIIHDGNFMLYCAKSYENPNCYDITEFYEDVNRFKYLKRLLSKYNETGELKERLILNHIIVIFNSFGKHATPRLLFFKLPEYHKEIATFLDFLNLLPDTLNGIGIDNKNINTKDIEKDEYIKKILKEL